MPNLNYNRGARKEQNLVRQARLEGKTSLRSAGSHSQIDVVIIDPVQRTIRLIQCKPANLPESQRLKILAEGALLNGDFKVSFEVV